MSKKMVSRSHSAKNLNRNHTNNNHNNHNNNNNDDDDDEVKQPSDYFSDGKVHKQVNGTNNGNNHGHHQGGHANQGNHGGHSNQGQNHGQNHGNHGGHGNNVTEIERLGPQAANITHSIRPLVLNSIGRQVFVRDSKSIMLNEWPFTVTRCDQVVKFKGKFIVDMEEYRGREDAWFTLTAMFVNMYRDEAANELVRSVMVSESPTLPKHIRGARPCILVKNSLHGDKDITICLETVFQERNILEVLDFFKTSCMAGLEKINKLAITKSIINCGGKGKFVDPRTLARRLHDDYYRTKNTKFFNGKWFHPGSDRVPGTLPPKKKKPFDISKLLKLK